MMELKVCALPKTRFAFTNKVYVNPQTFQSIILQQLQQLQNGNNNGMRNDVDDDTTDTNNNNGKTDDTNIHNNNKDCRILVGGVGDTHKFIYVMEQNEQVARNEIAMNGLHRQFARLRLGSLVSVELVETAATIPVTSCILFTVDKLTSTTKDTTTNISAGRKVIETNFLSSVVSTTLRGHVLYPTQVVAIEYNKEVKLKLTIRTVKLEDGSIVVTEKKKPNQGGVLIPSTDIRFRPDSIAITAIKLTGQPFLRGTWMGVGMMDDNTNCGFKLEDWGVFGLGNDCDNACNQIFQSTRMAIDNDDGNYTLLKDNENKSNTKIKRIVLSGPMGCGKLLLSYGLADALDSLEPINIAPVDLRDKETEGDTEGNGIDVVSQLLYKAENGGKKLGENSTRLHVFIVDGIEYIMNRSSRDEDETKTVVRPFVSSTFDELLSRIQNLDNALFIGTTRDKDLAERLFHQTTDQSLFDLWIEVGLPEDSQSRLKILQHYAKRSLDAGYITHETYQHGLQELAEKCSQHLFTPCELNGLVQSASSYSFTRCSCMSDDPELKHLKRGRGTNTISQRQLRSMGLEILYSDLERAFQDIVETKNERQRLLLSDEYGDDDDDGVQQQHSNTTTTTTTTSPTTATPTRVHYR